MPKHKKRSLREREREREREEKLERRLERLEYLLLARKSNEANGVAKEKEVVRTRSSDFQQRKGNIIDLDETIEDVRESLQRGHGSAENTHNHKIIDSSITTKNPEVVNDVSRISVVGDFVGENVPSNETGGDSPVVEEVSTKDETNLEEGSQAKENCQPETCELDEETKIILGEDPGKINQKEVIFHPHVKSCWTFWLTSGIPKEEREGLLSKYPRVGDCALEAPDLNPEITASLNESAARRDKHFRESQNIAGTALSALGTAISSILNDKKSPLDRFELLGQLWDVGRLLTDLHHSESVARRAYITPGLTKQVKTVLENANADKYLFGEKIGEKIKETKSIEKVAQDLKAQHTTRKPFQRSNQLNWKGPSVRQISAIQAGSRQKPYSRVNFHRKSQQGQGNFSRTQTATQSRPQPSQNRAYNRATPRYRQ